MSEEPSPTAPSERIVSLDVLRGFAILGILLINIRVFAMPEATLSNPTAYGDFSGANYLVWVFTHVFAEQKFLTLFTVMFGAGIVLFTERKSAQGLAAASLHYRRTALLVGIGLLHAYLLWYGDILVAYGVSGLLLVGARNLTPRKQFLAGLGMLALPSLLEVGVALTASADFASQWAPSEAAIQRELDAYRGGWLEQMDHRIETSLRRQIDGFVATGFWRIGGSMLLGMALFKTGVLSNERSRGFYTRLVAVGGGLGLAVILAGVWFITANDFDSGVALLWRQFNYWGSLALAGAYVGIVMLFSGWRPDGLVASALSAVGRTALSNYLFQTVLATSVFYGHGLGLFGSLTRVELMGVVVAIWAVQIPLSVLWLRYFRFGPVEWVWRTLTYGSRQPLRR
jgi:uncharacterized protein